MLSAQALEMAGRQVEVLAGAGQAHLEIHSARRAADGGVALVVVALARLAELPVAAVAEV